MAVLGELADRDKALYESKLKSLLEPAQKGKFVAIEPDTEQYFLGRTGTEALLAARAALPDKLFFLARVGYPAAASLKRLKFGPAGEIRRLIWKRLMEI